MKLDKNGQLSQEIDTKATRRYSNSIDAQLTDYLREMGINTALVDAIQRVRHDQSRELLRKEIAQFGIDARTFVESNWDVEILSVKKYVMEKEMDGADYRLSIFRMTCSGRGYASVYYTRDIGSNDAAAALSIKVTAGGRDFVLPPVKAPPKRTDSATRLIMTEARLPAVFFKPAAASDYILLTDVADEAQTRRPPHIVKLSTIGLAAPLAALLEQCDPNDPELAASAKSPTAAQTSK
jgi:hypothetical protein